MRLEFKFKKNPKNRWKYKILIMCLLGGALLGIYLSPIGQKAKQWGQIGWAHLCEKAHWNVTQVFIEGHKRTNSQMLFDTLKIKQNQPMNTISLNEIRQRLLQLPWIKEVVVERHLPGTLVIRITEKTPIALWQNNQNYQPLDETGHPIRDDKLLPADLILVVGSDAPENTLSLLAALEQVPSINRQVRSAVRVEKRRWNLHLLDAEKGLEIMLPETHFDQALKRLVFQNEKENLLRKNIEAIDLRLSDRIILHPKKSFVQKKGKK